MDGGREETMSCPMSSQSARLLRKTPDISSLSFILASMVSWLEFWLWDSEVGVQALEVLFNFHL